MSKKPLEWHRECLRNQEAYLVREREALESQRLIVHRLQNSVNLAKRQLAEADKRGLSEYDAARLLVKRGYAIAIIALLTATPAFAGGSPFFAGFGQGWLQTQQPSYPQHFPQYNSSIPPIPSIPPVGTSSCYPFRMCDVTGQQCIWQEVCR